MRRVRLIHWSAAEAKERIAPLCEAGCEVAYEPPTPAILRKLTKDPPAAVVIDLGRLPSQGRDVAIVLRSSKSTRHVPLVFVGGEPAKVARIQEILPDATYTTWSRIRGSLKRAMARPPKEPVVPESALAGYAGTPLVKKLGIRPDSVVALVGAPDGFEKTLGKLPPGAVLRRQARARRDLTLWFAKSQRDTQRRIERMAAFAENGGLWILWPKKSSGINSDLTQVVVRKVGLAAGLVDFKVAAVDATWSGLRFTRKKPG